MKFFEKYFVPTYLAIIVGLSGSLTIIGSIFVKYLRSRVYLVVFCE